MPGARQGPALVEAALLVIAVFGLALAAQIIGGPAASLPLVQLLAVGTPAVIYALAHPAPGAWLLGLARPRVRALAGGVLAGTGALALNLGAVVPLTFWALGEPRQAPPVILSGSIAWQLLAVALIPAVCEELVFRGVLMRSLARRSTWLAIAASAAVFALFHMSLYRLAPTFVVGVVTGLCLWRGGSTWVAIAAHLANNAVLVVLVSRVKQLGLAPPALVAVAGFLLVGSGLWLIGRSPDQ